MRDARRIVDNQLEGTGCESLHELHDEHGIRGELHHVDGDPSNEAPHNPALAPAACNARRAGCTSDSPR
jgi:hypothetical protein